MYSRDFKKAAEMFLDSIATFTAYAPLTPPWRFPSFVACLIKLRQWNDIIIPSGDDKV